mmetsp:Transcript_15958/g.30012  ORF Transcript_15958/g.30012 Transcript_15958/m.30012 type:complete len:237 (-) Transcript_15958:294-1004(-)
MGAGRQSLRRHVDDGLHYPGRHAAEKDCIPIALGRRPDRGGVVAFAVGAPVPRAAGDMAEIKAITDDSTSRAALLLARLTSEIAELSGAVRHHPLVSNCLEVAAADKLALPPKAVRNLRGCMNLVDLPRLRGRPTAAVRAPVLVQLHCDGGPLVLAGGAAEGLALSRPVAAARGAESAAEVRLATAGSDAPATPRCCGLSALHRSGRRGGLRGSRQQSLKILQVRLQLRACLKQLR